MQSTFYTDIDLCWTHIRNVIESCNDAKLNLSFFVLDSTAIRAFPIRLHSFTPRYASSSGQSNASYKGYFVVLSCIRNNKDHFLQDAAPGCFPCTLFVDNKTLTVAFLFISIRHCTNYTIHKLQLSLTKKYKDHCTAYKGILHNVLTSNLLCCLLRNHKMCSLVFRTTIFSLTVIFTIRVFDKYSTDLLLPLAMLRTH